MGLASLRALMAINPFVMIMNTIGLVLVSRQTRQYSAEELWGNSLVARHTILPAWRPLLVSISQVVAVVSVLQVGVLAIFGALRWTSKNRVDAWAWTDFTGIIIIMLDAIVPLTVSQHAVSRDAFRRSAALCGSHFLINTGLWAMRLGLKDHATKSSSSIYTKRAFFKVVSTALLTSAGILPAILLIATLSGIYATRLRVHSRTHRAAFFLYLAVAICWTISFALRFNTLHPPASASSMSTGAAYTLSLLMLLTQLLFPLATHKTLVADTKFWRGLGKYNANARFGDVRLSELCVQRSSTELPTDTTPPPPLIDTSSPAVVHPVVRSDEENQQHSLEQPPLHTNRNQQQVDNTDHWWTRQPPNEPNKPPQAHTKNMSGQHASVKSKRPRPEMGLEVASAKLQDIIEAADRDRRMLDFEHLNIESKVIGRGTTAYVYRGKYRDDKVAVKVFNPSEITEEYVDELGSELHLVATLRHRNVLALYGLCVRPPQLLAVFELCDGGSLASALGDLKFYDLSLGGLVDRRLVWAFDAASAVAYLHSHAIWHRDIKVDNFLVATGTTATVKLCDFGVSLRRSTALSRGEVWASSMPGFVSGSEATPKTPARRYASDMYSSTASKISAARLSETFIAPLRRRRFTAPSRTNTGSVSPPPISSGTGSGLSPPGSGDIRGTDDNTISDDSGHDNGNHQHHQPHQQQQQGFVPYTNKHMAQRTFSPPPIGETSARSSSSSPTNKQRTPRFYQEPLDDGQPLAIVGTVAYMAPELIEARRDYNEAVDVYALGVVLRCLWCRDPEPWPREAQTFEIYDNVTRGERPGLPNDTPEVLTSIINQAWHQDPAQRPDAETLRRDVLVAVAQLCGGQTAVSRLKQHVADSNADGARLLHRKSFVDKLLFASLWRPDEHQLDQDLEDLDDVSCHDASTQGNHHAAHFAMPSVHGQLQSGKSPSLGVAGASSSSGFLHSSQNVDFMAEGNEEEDKDEESPQATDFGDQDHNRVTRFTSPSDELRGSGIGVSFQSSLDNSEAVHCEDSRDTTIAALDAFDIPVKKNEEHS